MVALNFQKQFAEDVELGDKRQTMRLTARCKRGDHLQLYTGQRTKACRKLGDAICTRVRPVSIYQTYMELDGKQLIAGDAVRGEDEDRDNDFAKKDGFSGFTEMAEWFEKQYKKLPFHGFVIQWAEPR